MPELHPFGDAQVVEAGRLEVQLHRLPAPVHAEEAERAAVLGKHGRGVEVGHLPVRPVVVGRAIDPQVHRRAAPESRRVEEGPVDRLPPGRPAVLGHDGRDDVDELGEAGDRHAVGVADEAVEHAAHDEGVLEGVDVLEEAGPTCQGSAFVSASREWNQTFHSSKESFISFLLRFFALTWSQVATTESMNRSIPREAARKLARSSSRLP